MCCSFLIVFCFRFHNMLRAIQLYNKFRLVAEEIHDIISNYILPAKLHRILPQEIVPEKNVPLGCVFAQFLRNWCQILIPFRNCI